MRPDREPDLALQFWADGHYSYLHIDHGPEDKRLIADTLRALADQIERPGTTMGMN